MNHACRAIVLFMSGLIFTAMFARAQAPTSPDSQWQAVRSLTHRNVFTFVKRDQSCVTGEIKKVTDAAAVVRTSANSDITIEKPNVDRVIFGYAPRGVAWEGAPVARTVYSGRSSWNDLVQLGFEVRKNKWFKARMRVTTSSGKTYEGELRNATTSDVSIADASSEKTIAKSEISRVELIQGKPVSRSGEYWWDEAFPFQILDPELYPRLFHVGDTLSVRLYDTSMPQDDTIPRCK